MIDLDWIRKLIRLVDESDVDSLEVSRFGTSVKVRKSPPAGTAPAQPAAHPPAASSPPAGGGGPPPGGGSADRADAADAGEAGATEAAAEAAGEDLFEVESPMVGTFYRAPAPDAPPYVEVGDRVGQGQTLCILEAMKLMNEMESEVAGEIREICVQNAEPVEYGQVLFRIDTG
jgi:acetyl-CoA carboxylase biotin carboxyl carrier protein